MFFVFFLNFVIFICIDPFKALTMNNKEISTLSLENSSLNHLPSKKGIRVTFLAKRLICHIYIQPKDFFFEIQPFAKKISFVNEFVVLFKNLFIYEVRK